jgi:hypothetical protein
MSARIGRPGSYKASTGAIICRQLIEGKSLRAICKQDGMPARQTVHRWVELNEPFAIQFARARKLQAHTFVDDLQDIISVCLEIVNGTRDGTMEQIQAAKVCAENYRWMAGKALPSVYGDKLLHTGGDGEGPVAVKLSMDYSDFEPRELVELSRLVEKAKATAKRKQLLMIEGEVDDDDS